MTSPRRTLLLLLVVGGAVALAILRPWRDPPRLVVLISIDTLKPERLGVYGGQPGTSPNIDLLSRESVVFDQVLANSPWTLPSHMSMLTGLDPVAHGVWRDGFQLSGRVTTLAEALHKAGFRTGAFTAGGFVAYRYGFGQGFDVYKETTAPGGGAAGFAQILPEALDWLDGTRREDTFLFLHTFDVHAPYDKCDPAVLEEFRARPVQDGPNDYQLHRLSFMYQLNHMGVTGYQRFGQLLNDYDAGVHEADRGVGEVLEMLRESGRLDDALIIITSDHGESFAEHGIHIGHGLSLTDDEVHVPLIVRFPQKQFGGRRIDTLADLTDIAPTILEVLGIPAPAEMQGESLARLPAGKLRQRDYVLGLSQNTVTSSLTIDGWTFISSPSIPPMTIAKKHIGPMTPPAPGADPGETYELGHNTPPIMLQYDVNGDPLGIRDVLPEVPQLYDRAHDPQEKTNLYEQDRERVQLMTRSLIEIYRHSTELHQSLDDGQTPAPPNPQEEQQLIQLGYFAAEDPGTARQNLEELPQALREPLKHPYIAPDTKALVEADQIAQFIRRRLVEGTPLPEGASHALQDLGNRYVAWAVKNPANVARVRWRVEALTRLAEDAGVTLDMDQWRRRFIELERQATQNRVAPKEAPPAGATPPAAPDGAPASPDAAGTGGEPAPPAATGTDGKPAPPDAAGTDGDPAPPHGDKALR